MLQCENSRWCIAPALEQVASEFLDNVCLSSAADWLVVGKGGDETASTTGHGSQSCGVALEGHVYKYMSGSIRVTQ